MLAAVVVPPAEEGYAMRDPDPNTPIGRLKRRADFVRAAKGKRWHGGALTLQAVAREDGANDDGAPRVGFTLTKKVGGAVIRNRARRRLKEALRLAPTLPLRPGHDYVMVGRIEAIRLRFEALKSELARAVNGVHGEAAPRRKRLGPPENRPPKTGPRESTKGPG